MTTPLNPNIQWAGWLLAELAAAGMQHVCIAPGSRSTPLTLAAFGRPELTVHRHLDERSAGFFALGLALATETPVALICTSGTAVANFLPAVIEAYQSQVPLLLLTADRPPELRHSGANQTIDQVGIFGRHVLWSVDMPLPDAAAPPVAQRNYRTLAARAYAVAYGRRRGPVHLNLPFRKPLEPTPGSRPAQPLPAERALTVTHGRLLPAAAQSDALAVQIAAHPRGLIVCGPRCPGDPFPAAVAALARRSGYPILADPVSGVRFGPHVATATVVGAYESFLADPAPPWSPPDVIIRFGAVPTGKWLNAYLDAVPDAYRLHVRANGVWADDSHRVNHLWQVDETALCQTVTARLTPRTESPWLAQWEAAETAVWHALPSALDAGFYDGAAVYDLIQSLPDNVNLFAGNSLPIRHLDMFGRPTTRRLHAYANRGASGIDGNISTGIGLQTATGRPTVILVGDITFYHDMNGLLALKNRSANVTIVVLNNDGGGIFRRLPIAAIDPPFTELFVTPHGLDYAPAAALYGLDYYLATDRPTFQTGLAAALATPAPSLLELRTNGAHDAARHKSVLDTLNR